MLIGQAGPPASQRSPGSFPLEIKESTCQNTGGVLPDTLGRLKSTFFCLGDRGWQFSSLTLSKRSCVCVCVLPSSWDVRFWGQYLGILSQRPDCTMRCFAWSLTNSPRFGTCPLCPGFCRYTVRHLHRLKTALPLELSTIPQ